MSDSVDSDASIAFSAISRVAALVNWPGESTPPDKNIDNNGILVIPTVVPNSASKIFFLSSVNNQPESVLDI